MPARLLAKPIRLLIASLGLLLFLGLLLYFFLARSVQRVSVPRNKNTVVIATSSPVTSPLAASVLPVRLSIPRIKINIALESVGLTAQGAVDVPKSQTKAAWFNLSPVPGAIGDSVIDGHFGRWKNGQEAVFNNLSTLRKGDKLYVTDAQGKISIFIVRQFMIYDPGQNAPEVFISNDGKAHLNLITCDGPWDKISQNYSKRFVVFTDKELF
jgi:LPXTG-site transpeptidase (sortase) family protein